MSAVNDGGPAFPILERGGQGLELSCVGMSLRDYFAAKAMHGLMTMDGVKVGEEGMQIPKHADIVAEIAYQMAGAMLKARAKEGDAA